MTRQGGRQKASAHDQAALPKARPTEHEKVTGERHEALSADAASNRALAVLHGRGMPLEPRLRSEMEARFGARFDAVRVHDDEDAHGAAEAAHAKAFTFGNHIAFGDGRFAPGTSDGRQLLAHELAHVVQQTRGGPAPDGSRPQLEAQAALAAQTFSHGSGPVMVGGASAPGVMHDHDPELDDDAERRHETRKQRQRDKTRDEQRADERHHAGKTDAQKGSDLAEKTVRKMEEHVQQPGGNLRGKRRREKKQNKLERLLPATGGSQLDKNQRKGDFDEAQRTPTGRGAKAQGEYVAGGAKLPDQVLSEPGGRKVASHTRPDYSIYRRRADGSQERVHVNLKSNQIDRMTPGEARAAARDILYQAVGNRRHLPDGEKLIIDFAHIPSKEVRQAIENELFRKGSDTPVAEIRFGGGSIVLREADYDPPGGRQPLDVDAKSRRLRIAQEKKAETQAAVASKKASAQQAKADKASAAKAKPAAGGTKKQAAADKPKAVDKKPAAKRLPGTDLAEKPAGKAATKKSRVADKEPAVKRGPSRKAAEKPTREAPAASKKASDNRAGATKKAVVAPAGPATTQLPEHQAQGAHSASPKAGALHPESSPHATAGPIEHPLVATPKPAGHIGAASTTPSGTMPHSAVPVEHGEAKVVTPNVREQVQAHSQSGSGAARIAGHVAAFGVTNVVSYFLQKWTNDVALNSQQATITKQIGAKLDAKTDEINMLLAQTNFRKTIYANVTVTVGVIITPAGKDGHGGGTSPPLLYLDNVEVSTHDLSAESRGHEWYGYAQGDKQVSTYSFPIVETQRLADMPSTFAPLIAQTVSLLQTTARNYSVAGSAYASLNRDLTKTLAELGDAGSLYQLELAGQKDPLALGPTLLTASEQFDRAQASLLDVAFDFFDLGLEPDKEVQQAAALLRAMDDAWPGEIRPVGSGPGR